MLRDMSKAPLSVLHLPQSSDYPSFITILVLPEASIKAHSVIAKSLLAFSICQLSLLDRACFFLFQQKTSLIFLLFLMLEYKNTR